MLAQVLVAEADSFVAMCKDLKLADGYGRVVPGRVPHRAIQTEVGPFEVRRARCAIGATARRGENALHLVDLPKRVRRTNRLDACCRLRGVSTGDFQKALAALLGKDARTCRRR